MQYLGGSELQAAGVSGRRLLIIDEGHDRVLAKAESVVGQLRPFDLQCEETMPTLGEHSLGDRMTCEVGRSRAGFSTIASVEPLGERA